MIEYILSPQSIEALGWTLLHSLWQGAAFAILLALLFIALRSYTAQSRYVVAVGLLCAFFLTVSVTFSQHWQQASKQSEPAVLAATQPSVDNNFVLKDNAERVLLQNNEDKNTVLLDSEKIATNQSSWLLTFKDYYKRHLPLLVTIWFLGVLFLQLRFLGQLAYVQRLKHYGTQLIPAGWSDRIEELEGKLRIQKKVKYLTSVRIESPMVIGWLKPVVLLPRTLFNNLSETEIYAVLAHELAHIRREDFMVNLLQTFLCNVFFFHPGVWWMSNRIDDEREHCCDDLAVAATGPAVSYAKTLINVSELQLKMQGNTPLAMAFSGKRKKRERGGFSGRIRRLFTVKNGAGSFREGFATACILITALFLGVAATGNTLLTETKTETKIALDTELTTKAKAKTTFGTETTTETTINNKATTELGDYSSSTKVDVSVDLNELPVAAPEEPESPVSPVDTRIDALVMACGEGDLDFVKTLVHTGIDVNGIGSDGFTPLMKAASENEVEVVDYLLSQGAEVNQNNNGWTALHEAANEGSKESMKLLLKAGADVNYFANQGRPTAISVAAAEGKLKCLQLLVDHGAAINGIGKSIPPLHLAAGEHKRATLDYLISKKANLNKKDVAGRTALMYAASEGNEYAVVKLIEAGADISIVDLNGATARDYAEEEGLEYEWNSDENFHSDGDDKRVDLSASKRPKIHQATIDGHIEKVKRMVERGTDVNTRDAHGQTLLHLAAAKNHTNDINVLINLGADINAEDNDGRTPLMYAAADGSEDAAILLVSRQADFNIEDIDGMRAYEWARFGRNEGLTSFLGLITTNKSQNKRDRERKERKEAKRKYKKLEKNDHKSSHIDIFEEENKELQKEMEKQVFQEMAKRETFHIADDGAHLRQYDMKVKSPDLLEAVKNGSVDDCHLLLNNGLSANAADGTGQTALMVAALSNRLDIAKVLITRGADVNKSSASGLTALHYAALGNHDKMAQLLLKHNAKVDPTMRYSSTDGNYSKEPLVWEYIGATPLLIAVESGNAEVLSVLIEAGANTNHRLTRNEYKLKSDRENYLSGSEVMGFDDDFLKDVEVRISNDNWTPYKHALLLNKPSILSIFQK